MPSSSSTKNTDRPGGFKHYLREHKQTAGESIDQLWLKPLGSLMTILLIGLSLTLPLALIVILENGRDLVGSWQGQSTVSLFLSEGLSEPEGLALSKTLAARDDIRKLRYLSKAQSLQEFESSSGITVSLELLGENPLPAVIIVEARNGDPAALDALRGELSSFSGVAFAQLDLQWVKRLQAMLQVGVQSAQVMALVFTLVVLFVVMNTLKLLIAQRRSEIDITLLVGGSHAYIRRPFLYLGLWYGLFGGLLAVTLVEALLWWVEGPIANMASLYDSSFHVKSMPVMLFLQALIFSSLLGVVAAWIEASAHLRRALPR
ncbi:MAG: permease-like cell division protein FtsX [Gammaproteobacteria bacterium]|nr:permease-like cell division protein FtsX [Gammaproteobacteria bacterium]